jgi:hypothetical protein
MIMMILLGSALGKYFAIAIVDKDLLWPLHLFDDE